MTDSSFTIHICPPQYPERFEPFECRHEPVMQISNTKLHWKTNGGGYPVVEHARCMACGAPVGTGVKRNIFVDIVHLMQMDMCQTGPLRTRLLEMREIYLKRSLILFGHDGWLGDDGWRELAEIIDPTLTMRVFDEGSHADGTQFIRVAVDETHFPIGRHAKDEGPQSQFDFT